MAAPDTSALLPRLRVVRRLISKAEELMDAIVTESGDERLPLSSRSTAPATQEGRSGRTRRRRRFSDPALRRLAEPGIGTIDLQPLDAHHMRCSVDGAGPFRVSSGQAALLAVIAFVESASDDGFTPFQSLDDVIAVLEKKTGRQSTIRALTVAISRLREVFQVRGQVNPLMIETCRARGVRLRLRRPAL